MIIELLLATQALACSPVLRPELPFSAKVKAAGAVFVGTVSGPEKNGKVPVKVLHAFKGDVKGTVTYLQNAHGTCSFGLEEGATYLLLAGQRTDGTYASNAFTGSTELSFAGPSLRELLGRKAEEKLPELGTCLMETSVEKRQTCAAEVRKKLGQALGVNWLP